MKFPESALAHQLFDGKKGIEIGPSAHNPFGLTTISFGRATAGTPYAAEELRLCGEVAPVHIVGEGDALPFPDNYFDFVIASHVLEHFYDPIKTLKEWLRVVGPGGMVFVIFPHKDRTFDKDKPRTPIAELLRRHAQPDAEKPPAKDEHHTIWVTVDAIELCLQMKWNLVKWADVDDKVGNGFVFVIQK